MITKINKIRNFGVFKDYNWNCLNFTKFNLIYGWNYSGKTTLSRVFRCFETGEKYVNCNMGTFELVDENGKLFNETELRNTLFIRVFNSDFVKENIKWESEFEPIFLLGQESIALQSKLSEIKDSFEKATKEIKRLRDNKKIKSDSLESGLTEYARMVKLFIQIPNYTKSHFEPIVKNTHTPHEFIKTDEELQNLLNDYKFTEKKDSLPLLSFNPANLATQHNTVKELIGKTVSSVTIERLKNDPDLNEWVKEGRKFHEGKKICQFCGQDISDDFMEELGNHFSEDYEKFILSLNELENQLGQSLISTDLPSVDSMYIQYKDSYKVAKEELGLLLNEYNSHIYLLIQKVQEKKTQVFNVVELIEKEYGQINIIEKVQIINELFSENNKKTIEFDSLKNNAKAAIINHYAAQFIIDRDYYASNQDIDKLTAEIETEGRIIQQLEGEIEAIEAQLSETTKGANEINTLLSKYFGNHYISIRTNDNNKFVLYRGEETAKDLSEGEKTAIAFTYFITKLRDKSNNYSNLIVFIDDPISSLDSKHLFNTFSLIKNQFYAFVPRNGDNPPQHNCTCNQLFISTHNYELLNLVKEWFSKVKLADRSFHIVERLSNEHIDKSLILDMPDTILKYQSEYMFLFDKIKLFKKNPSQTSEHLYNMPNIVRRFLEIYLSFKYLSTANIDENIGLLVRDPIECEKVRKFVHYYSHALSSTRHMQICDASECSSVIEIVFQSE